MPQLPKTPTAFLKNWYHTGLSSEQNKSLHNSLKTVRTPIK
ncbi:hypothetical protein NT07LI_3807 [Listeria innocua FSL S4-378]|nr:hypothetical protein NT07LI_3807 [Listeria innocua FSL S4-378]